VVINADSMQVYRGLEVLSAAPDAATRARAPHRLYGVLDPAELCSAGGWRDMATAELKRAHGAGLLPVVVGGTGLYLRSLTAGIARMPPVPREVRERVRARMAAEGSRALHAELQRRDPETAARLEPGDRQRIARALEILEATGKPLAAWQRGGDAAHETDGLRFFIVLLMPPRETLYADCDRRFAEMASSGALDEVRRLGERHLDPDLPAMKALGVPDLLRHLAGEISLEEACRQGQQATRRYVKRQVTWFRHQIVADYVLKTKYTENLKDEIFSEISRFLLTYPG
jgi:tRNA dimethylallyltransferase